MPFRRSVAYAALALGVAGVACAVGTTDDGSGGGGSGDEDGGTGTDAGESFDAGGGGFDAGDNDAGGGGDDSGGGTGDGGGGGGDAGSDGGGGGIACTVTNTCLLGRAIGSVSGDTTSAAASGTGTTSEWLTVRVTEDDSSPFGTKLRAKVTLTSPPGTNFDLYLYVNTGSDTRECNTVTAQSVQTGTSDSASLNWGEGTISNGSDDSRTVSIEVRHVSGNCDPGSKWSVQVQGNQ